MIQFCQPDVGESELAAIREVFSTSWLGTGPRVTELEAAFAAHLDRSADDLVAVTSCTEGLHQAFATLGLGPGDEVVLPSISFLGAAHAAHATGARVVPCDVDPRSLNPTVAHVEAVLGPATRAVCVLHFAGAPGHVAEIARLAAARGIALVEDAALATGTRVGDRACGTFGDIGVWSFDAMKTITTGDGGMMWIRDEDRVADVRAAIKMGVGSSGLDRTVQGGNWWEVEPVGVGRRAAMNDVAAAMGLVQLERLETFLTRRADVASRYTDAIGRLGWLQPLAPRPPGSAWTYYGVQTAPGLRDHLAQHLLAAGVYANFRYWPLHRMAMYPASIPLPGADAAAARTLLLPLHPSLSEADVDAVIGALGTFPA